MIFPDLIDQACGSWVAIATIPRAALKIVVTNTVISNFFNFNPPLS